ncbi:MAG TPA: peptidoglycan recognition family protein [Blastocatellia bacterium]|nr:peptidoglycan recognition family protein [Blastocatellia bacterium]
MSDLAQNSNYTRLVDRYSRYINSPVLRLKFLGSAMSAKPRRGRSPLQLLKRIPLLGTLSERARLIVELSKHLPADKPMPFALRLTSFAYRARLAVYAAALCLALSIGAGAVYLSAKLVNGLSVSTQAKGVAPANTDNVEKARAVSAANTLAAVGSQAGLPPEKVWLAEQGAGYEFYSNGARILTEFETNGPERRFYRFDHEGNVRDEGSNENKPIGIVYHLSEGDQLPFSNRYNSSLQNVSRQLLEYARDKRLYNYLIDRFGRIHRLVGDEFAADHAGNSLWSDGNNTYVNLSASFIGICLEGRSGAGSAVGPDGINEAQIYAARVLTAVLRSRYGIADVNCVTHGLVSVNPSNKLVGYHTDWIAGFPFEALGLTSKYDVELAAISEFGFLYDHKYLAAAGGKKWPGLERSESRLRESARVNNRTLDEERRSRWESYHRAYSVQHELDQQRGVPDSDAGS